MLDKIASGEQITGLSEEKMKHLQNVIDNVMIHRAGITMSVASELGMTLTFLPPTHLTLTQ
ncbi:MAG: hypothetical protein JRN10_02810 [Nitrososphaerota archaeon]|nr:hypothetical protein [Nitrososphaerota archaeon]